VRVEGLLTRLVRTLDRTYALNSSSSGLTSFKSAMSKSSVSQPFNSISIVHTSWRRMRRRDTVLAVVYFKPALRNALAKRWFRAASAVVDDGTTKFGLMRMTSTASARASWSRLSST
jgi:hypothetical protein